MLADGSVDALDPKRAEGPLAVLAVAIGVLSRPVDRRLGGADGVLAPAVKAFGALQDFLVLGVRCDAALHSRHGGSPGISVGQGCCRKYCLMLSPSDLNRIFVPRRSRICFLVRLIIMWRLP